MREVSCRATRMLIEVVTSAGVNADELVLGLPTTLDELRDRKNRIDWDVFARFCDRIEKVCAGKMTLEEVGARLVTAPSNDFFRRVGPLLVSPYDLYRIGGRLVAPALFANVVVRHQIQPGRRLVLTGELPEGYRPSEAFFRICNANAAELPRFLGLPPSEIEEQSFTGMKGRLVLVVPASHTVGMRLVRSISALRHVGEVFHGVARQQIVLEESLDALRTSRQEFRELLERLPIGVVIHRDGVVRWVNMTMLEVLGFSAPNEVVGSELLSLLHPEDREAIAVAVAEAPPRRVAVSPVEYRVVRRDGSIRRVQAAATQHVEYEGAAARLVLCRDVTEDRDLQEQLIVAERLASLGTLAAGVAHEINNPLAFVQTSLEVLAREMPSLRTTDAASVARVEALLGYAREGTERVRGIVRDLKTLSHGEDEAVGPVDVEALIESTLAIAGRSLEARARVVRKFGPIPPARATRGRLGQVVLNLLINAADATPEGSRERYEIRVATSTDAKGRAVIEVSDDGPGIAPHIARRIFDPFFTTKAVGSGMGLGLAICHRIVTQLGGELSFESARGAPTTFRVVLPAADVPVAAETAQNATTAPKPARARVLIVDDEPTLLRTVRWLLAGAHDVSVASSGREALDLLREDSRFDVVLADLMMDGVTGMDLYDAVRDVHPGLEKRMVFMTGGPSTRRSHEFLARVSNPRIEKPFSAAELEAAISLSAQTAPNHPI